MGNLNARAGIEDYTLHLDNHISKLLPDTNSVQHRNQRPCDEKTKSYGWRYYSNSVITIILKLLIDKTLEIGVGNYTCFNREGACVAD